VANSCIDGYYLPKEKAWLPEIEEAITSLRAAIEQAEGQEPVAWRNAAIRVGEDLCSVGPFSYYDMTAEQWLDWALSVVTVHAPPAAQPAQPAQPALVHWPLSDGLLKITLQVGDHKVSHLVPLAVIETSNAPEVERHAGQAWAYLQNAIQGTKEQA
jgi:uncharacterized protein YqcC (DUF446 family)